MNKIKKMFDHYIDGMFGGREQISEEQYREEEKSFYAGFATCFDIFKNEISGMSVNNGVFEIYMLERELEAFVRSLVDQINYLTIQVEKYEQK